MESKSDEQWRWALDTAADCKPGTMGSALVMLDWAGLKNMSIRDLMMSDKSDGLELFGAPRPLALTQQCHRALLPGAHIALWVPGFINDLGGLALRLAGFEIRDAISVFTEDEVFYWHIGRKAMPGNIIESTLAHGTGGINIGACRIGTGKESQGPRPSTESSSLARYADSGATDFAPTPGPRGGSSDGRFPPNVILGDTESVSLMDRQAPAAGGSGPASGPTYSGASKSNSMAGKFAGMGDEPPTFHGDSGGASRFFPKAEGEHEFGAAWVKRLIDTPEAPCLDLS